VAKRGSPYRGNPNRQPTKMSGEVRSNIVKAQASRNVDVNTAKTLNPYHPGKPQVPGGDKLPFSVEVTFNGPDIVAQSGVQNTQFTFDENSEGTVASRFINATSYALSLDSDALPVGLSVNAVTGNIEGTPTETGTFSNIIIKGS
jgi:hypothetical protein